MNHAAPVVPDRAQESDETLTLYRAPWHLATGECADA